MGNRKGYGPPFVKEHRRAAATFRGKLLKLANALSAALSYENYQAVPALEDADFDSVDDVRAGMRDGIMIGLFAEFYASLTEKERFLHDQVIIKLDTSRPISVLSYVAAAMQVYREFGYDFDPSGFPFVLYDGELQAPMHEWLKRGLCTVDDIAHGELRYGVVISDDWPMFWPYMPRE